MSAVTVAGIDCGTNSIRLMIANVDENGLHELKPRDTRVVHLGEKVDQTHCFTQAALQRTFAAAEEFADILEHYQVEALRFVATSASRDALNRDEFEAGIQRILSVTPEVISGEEEAQLSFLGAVSVLKARQQSASILQAPYLVVDLGGGSTELVMGGDGVASPADQVQASYSMDIGSVRMTERHLLSDPATKQQIQEAVSDIDSSINRAFQQVPVRNVKTVIGVSGTITTMSALAVRLKTYDREAVDGAQISIAQVHEANRELLAMNSKERSDCKVIHSGRVGVIPGGAIVWDRLLERLQEQAQGMADAYIASEHGLLDGVVLDLGRRCLDRRS